MRFELTVTSDRRALPKDLQARYGLTLVRDRPYRFGGPYGPFCGKKYEIPCRLPHMVAVPHHWANEYSARAGEKGRRAYNFGYTRKAAEGSGHWDLAR
jgi:hypothetical protein